MSYFPPLPPPPPYTPTATAIPSFQQPQYPQQGPYQIPTAGTQPQYQQSQQAQAQYQQPQQAQAQYQQPQQPQEQYPQPPQGQYQQPQQQPPQGQYQQLQPPQGQYQQQWNAPPTPAYTPAPQYGKEQVGSSGQYFPPPPGQTSTQNPQAPYQPPVNAPPTPAYTPYTSPSQSRMPTGVQAPQYVQPPAQQQQQQPVNAAQPSQYQPYRPPGNNPPTPAFSPVSFQGSEASTGYSYVPPPAQQNQPAQVQSPVGTTAPSTYYQPSTAAPLSQAQATPNQVPAYTPESAPTPNPNPVPAYAPDPAPAPNPNPVPAYAPDPTPAPNPNPVPAYSPEPVPTSAPSQVPPFGANAVQPAQNGYLSEQHEYPRPQATYGSAATVTTTTVEAAVYGQYQLPETQAPSQTAYPQEKHEYVAPGQPPQNGYPEEKKDYVVQGYQEKKEYVVQGQQPQENIYVQEKQEYVVQGQTQQIGYPQPGHPHHANTYPQPQQHHPTTGHPPLQHAYSYPSAQPTQHIYPQQQQQYQQQYPPQFAPQQQQFPPIAQVQQQQFPAPVSLGANALPHKDKDAEKSGKAKRFFGDTLVGRGVRSSVSTVTTTLKLPASLSPWGDNNPVTLPNVRYRDAALFATFHVIGGPLVDGAANVVGDMFGADTFVAEIASSSADFINGNLIVKYGVFQIVEQAIDKGILEHMLPEVEKTMRTTSLKSMQVAIKHKLMGVDADLRFVGECPTRSATSCDKGWFCPYLYASSRAPFIARSQDWAVAQCFNPYLAADTALTHKLLSELPSVIPLCDPNPTVRVGYSRLLVLFTGITPFRANMWSTSRRPGCGQLFFHLFNGCVALVMPVVTSLTPILAWSPWTLDQMQKRPGSGYDPATHHKQLTDYLITLVDKPNLYPTIKGLEGSFERIMGKVITMILNGALAAPRANDGKVFAKLDVERAGIVMFRY